MSIKAINLQCDWCLKELRDRDSEISDWKKPQSFGVWIPWYLLFKLDLNDKEDSALTKVLVNSTISSQ